MFPTPIYAVFLLFFFSLTILTFNDAFVTTVLQLGVLAICF